MESVVIVIGYQFSRIGGQPDHTVGIALTFSPAMLERYQERSVRQQIEASKKAT